MFQENFNFIEESPPEDKSASDAIRQSAAIAFKRKIEAKKRAGFVLSVEEENFLNRNNKENLAVKIKEALNKAPNQNELVTTAETPNVGSIAEKAKEAIAKKNSENALEVQRLKKQLKKVQRLKKQLKNLNFQILEFNNHLQEATINKREVIFKLIELGVTDFHSDAKEFPAYITDMETKLLIESSNNTNRQSLPDEIL